jgi:hypothetical protein
VSRSEFVFVELRACHGVEPEEGGGYGYCPGGVEKISIKVILTSVSPGPTLSLQAKGLFKHARSDIHGLSDDDHKTVAHVLKAERFIDLCLQPNDSASPCSDLRLKIIIRTNICWLFEILAA